MDMRVAQFGRVWMEKVKRFFRRAPQREQPRSARVGAWGEACAARYLRQQGYRIVGQNVRPTQHDELDILALKGETLVFVEVKTRKRDDFVRPVRAVDAAKRHALNRAAAAYVRRARQPNLFYRFDVIEVVGQPEAKEPPTIRHLENVFAFESRFYFSAGAR